jgi:hypothetical protein
MPEEDLKERAKTMQISDEMKAEIIELLIK